MRKWRPVQRAKCMNNEVPSPVPILFISPTSLEHFSSSSRLDFSFSLAEVSGSASCLAYAHPLNADPTPCRRPAREPSMLLDIVFSVCWTHAQDVCGFSPGKSN